ncbi:glutathione S-transferase T3 [Triticum aestivum]|uniref:glutathione S-transferase T3 n=1 Tax=Triticum aestivum TaxID=4565 RepID=UPI001D030992|nr:glutathione S-transferase T3-like [Triticum aestivum]
MENSYELDSQINNSSFLDMMNVGSSDTNCYGTADCSPLAEQVTMPPQKGKKSAKPKSAKGASTKGENWSTVEDLVLIQAWANTSLDAVTGTDQNSSTYWGRISDHYDAHKKPSWPERGSNGLTCRYNVISALTSKFCACIQQILNRNCSGMTLSDKERDAHRMYIELDEKKKPFTLMHCYIEFEKYPKWQTRPLPQKKQKNTSDASPSTTSNDKDFGACTDALEEELRPPGTKHDKNERLRKGKTSESNDSGCKLSLESVWAQKIEKDDIKEATKIARYARAFELQEKQIALQEKEDARKQFELDEKIMLMDTSHMSDAHKQFYKNKQDEIIARCQNTSG